jgi:tetratricopeptide (TPR) repeat protein
MSSDYRIETNPDYLRIWEQIIRQWNGAASWNGLIAHIQGGVFAALGSLEIIREKLRKLLNADFPEDVIKRPLGAYASANYSLAKRMVHKHDRKHVLETALRYANETIEDQKDKETGIYAVRGSIYLRQRKPFAATRDFKRTVKHYESLANGNSGLGHAYLNLGTAYCFSGRLLKGQEFLIRGHQILSKDENGPHIQSLRRLAKFYKLTGRKTKSEGYRNQAVRLAEKLHMYDQLRQIQAD